MSALILAGLVLPLAGWVLQRDMREADRKRRLREAMRRKDHPLSRFAAAWDEFKSRFVKAFKPAAQAHIDAFRGLVAAFRAAESSPPLPHRWFKVGEPECECPACPRGGAR